MSTRSTAAIQSSQPCCPSSTDMPESMDLAILAVSLAEERNVARG